MLFFFENPIMRIFSLNLLIFKDDYPARKPIPLSSSPPQAEDSFYPPKMENPPHFLLL